MADFSVKFSSKTASFEAEQEQKKSDGTYDHNELISRDRENQHPIYAITGLKERLEEIQDLHYTHIQAGAARVWEIAHPLNKMPSVVVCDSAGSVVVGDIVYLDEGHLTITFSGGFSGRAYLN